MSRPCERCNEVEVFRKRPFGRFPICEGCRDRQWETQLQVQRERRLSGEWQSHFDPAGKRYDYKKAWPPKCEYCHGEFVNKRRGSKTSVCPSCSLSHKEELKKKKTDRAKTEWLTNKPHLQRLSMARRLRTAGLDPEWYDRQEKKCGICSSEHPRGRGRWHIDHCHSCCEKGCAACVRGLLCHHCNVGLGNFKDNPTFLLSAINWLRDHPVRLSPDRMAV